METDSSRQNTRDAVRSQEARSASPLSPKFAPSRPDVAAAHVEVASPRPLCFPTVGAPLRIVAISDTHERHWELTAPQKSGNDFLPPGDVLVHCGDIFRSSRRASQAEFTAKANDFNAWLGSIKNRYVHGIVVVPGNHDFWLEELGVEASSALLSNCRYLVHAGCTIAGVSFYGCPVSYGASANKAFQKLDGGEKCPRRMLPASVDVLITHGSYVNGCHEQGSIMKNFVFPRRHDGFGARCRLHIAGHDHDNYGAVLYRISETRGSVEDFCNSPQIWQRTPPPRCPLPQIRRIGRVDESTRGPTDAMKALAARYPELMNDAPSQPSVLRCLHEIAETGKPSDTRTGVTIRCQTVSVVASSLNMKYRLAYRPVEIDIHAILRTELTPQTPAADLRAEEASTARHEVDPKPSQKPAAPAPRLYPSRPQPQDGAAAPLPVGGNAQADVAIKRRKHD